MKGSHYHYSLQYSVSLTMHMTGVMTGHGPATGRVCEGGRFSVIAMRNTIMASMALMPSPTFSPDSAGNENTSTAAEYGGEGTRE